MNVIAKARPFPKRKPALLPQATASAETFVRYVTAKAHAQLLRVDPLEVAKSRWPADKSVRDIIRAVAEPPTDLSTTPALAVAATDFVESLKPISAAAQLMSNGLLLSFDRYARIVLPDFTALDDLSTPFVGAGQPAPVAEMQSQATTLDPYKIEVIVTVTKETILGGNADRLIGDALKRQAAFALDRVLFDAHPGDATRPPGLRASARLAESTALDNFTAMMRDVGSLLAASEHIAAASPFFLIARSRRISAMRTMMKVVAPNLTLLPSAAQALPESALLCVVPLALASAVGLPEVELVEHATIEMNDAPGSPDLAQAQRVRSLFQTDTVGIKLRIPASWALRNPAGANWVTCIWPSDIGGGGEGMPEAPFDEFTYGRHQGGWSQVVDEPPSTPPTQAYVRLTPGGPTGWFPLDGVLVGTYAPILSPAFFGSPTAPNPPPGDASQRLATTQFVRDNAGSGGGGIDEAPTDGNTYGRRNNYWQQLEAVFASLLSPQLQGNPTAPTPGQGNRTTRLATTEFVDTDYLAKAGGQMSGPLIAAPGSSVTNCGLAIGDNATGFYRAGNTLVVAASGDLCMQFLASQREIMFAYGINAAINRIINVGDATTASDALNLRTGDARYLSLANGGIVNGPIQLYQTPIVPNDVTNKQYVDNRVDNRLAAPVVFDLPANVLVAGDDAWHSLAVVRIMIPRLGNSLIAVAITCNIQEMNAIGYADLRLAPVGMGAGAITRRVWLYGAAGTPASGFTTVLYSEIAGGGAIDVPISIKSLAPSGAPPNFTVIGGAVDLRSQIAITDLGPV